MMLLASILVVWLLATIDFIFPLLIQKFFKIAQWGRHNKDEEAEEASCNPRGMYV